MKVLYLIRHAKSAWDFASLEDFHRPLNQRGRNDLLRMSDWVAKKCAAPDYIITSPASRALYTSLYFSDAWKFKEKNIRLDIELYLATSIKILEICQEVKNVNSLAIFGHNPGMTDLVNEISTSRLDNLPTCGVCKIEFKVDKWNEISPANKGTLTFFAQPSDLKNTINIQ